MAELWTQDPRAALQVSENFDLTTFDRAGKPGFTGAKRDAAALIANRGALMAELQERLYACGRSGEKRNVLIIVQGLDTAGKGGIARHVMGMVDPQGVALSSFGVPTEVERQHHYLWRIENALPGPGKIGLFDRSHYEDVLVARVDNLVEEAVWSQRYEEINNWEKSLVENGTIVLKFALLVSYEEQAKRLMERLDRPDKRWKYSMSDLKTRSKWNDYQAAYADVFKLTSTSHAPWHVLPADRKWFPRLAVTEILTRTLIEMDLRWPRPSWRPTEQRAQLAETMSATSLAESLASTSETVSSALAESLDVNFEAADLRSRGADHDAATAEIEAKRREWEADLASTLDQKRTLLAKRAPELLPAEVSDTPAEKSKKKRGGKNKKKGKRK